MKETIKQTKNKRKNYSIMLFCLFGIMILFMSSLNIPVIAWSTEDIIVWDDYQVDVTSGTGDFYSWNTTEGEDGIIKVYSVNGSTKSLYQFVDYPVTSQPDTTIISLDYDMYTTVTGIKFWFSFNIRGAEGSDWSKLQYDFYQDSTLKVRLQLIADTTNIRIRFLNANDTWINLQDTSLYQLTWYTRCIKITYHSGSAYGDLLNYSILDHNYNLINSTIETLAQWQGYFDWINEVNISSYQNGDTYTKDLLSYTGNFEFDQTGYIVEGEVLTNLYFEIHDLETSEQLDVYGYSFIGAEYPPYIRTKIHSDLWGGDYSPTSYFGDTITLENLDLPPSGSWHWFNFTGISGYAGGSTKVYQNSTNYLFIYPTQTFTIYITDVVIPDSDYSNCKTCQGGLLTYPTELCTDKDSYVQGESINFRYKTPTMAQLKSVPFTPWNYYYLWIYNINNLHWLWGTTDGGQSQENWQTSNYNTIGLDGIYHTLQWNYNATGESGYKTVTGGIDEYKAYVGHAQGGLFGFDSILCGDLQFHIIGGIFNPSGNITSVSPSSPELGQRTQITFDVNNHGYMSSRNLLAPLDTELTITTFAKFSGSRQVNYTFWDFGEYLITLYVSDGFDYTAVDTETVSITTLNGSYGGFGYDVEFLTCEPARVIAGFDTLFVNYRSLSSNGYILVNDSRGQQTPYSTKVGIKTGVLNISIPNYAEIGKWNITLFGNSTLYSSFQVVAEENNWVEFYKNIFYDDEQFYIELKHDRKIKVVFYKDDVAYGRDWFLDIGILTAGIFPVPVDIAYPEIGEWKVQIIQVNDFIKKQLLAEDTCTVKQRPPDTEITVDDDIAGYLSNIDEFYKGLIGIFIVLLCTFMPFIAIRKLGEHGVNFKVDIPPMLYTICCGVGGVVALILGVWVIEYTFFICVMAGFGTFALYLMGKRGNGE